MRGRESEHVLAEPGIAAAAGVAPAVVVDMQGILLRTGYMPIDPDTLWGGRAADHSQGMRRRYSGSTLR